LVGHRFLRREAVAELDAAYRYLRVVENRLQQWNDEQTHQLPEDELGRTRLALAMNASDWNALSAELALHRERVAQHFAQTVFGPGATSPEQESRTALVDMDAPPLDQLRDTAYYRRLDETGRRRLHELLGRLLPLAAQSKSPETTLVRMFKILERIGGRTVYLALLNENATAMRRLVSLCEQSQFLTDQIAAQP